LVHGHCHQKAIMGAAPEVSWLKKAGIDAELLDSGCCGMAGSFGFEKDKYDVSVKCGEHALLPEVRDAAPETLIVASGFSCQEQIAQLTERRALHLAQVLEMALKQDGSAPEKYPEHKMAQAREDAVRRSITKSAASTGAVLLAGAGALWALRRAA
jgi:hypothetical protein